MSGELNVDVGSLHTGAASSDNAAASLAGTALSNSTNTQPSAAGVAAVNAALAALRGRQSIRITDQAGDMSSGAAAYGRADADGSDAINAVQV